MNSIFLSTIIGAVVAVGGHCYSSYHAPSNRDVVLSYFLGVLVAVFASVFIFKRSTPGANDSEVHHGSYVEPPFYEHDFYFNTWGKGFDLVLFIGMSLVGVWFAWEGRYIPAAFLLLITGFILKDAIREFIDRSPQLRIAQGGIWLKGFGYHPWDDIRKIDLHNEQIGKNEVPTLDIYLKKSDDGVADFSLEIKGLSKWKEIGGLLKKIAKTKVKNTL